MSRRGGRGALLLDVVVAMFILCVGLLAVVGLFIQAVQVGRALNRHEQAACLALEAMEQWRNQASEDESAESLATLSGSEQLTKDGTVFERITTCNLRTDIDASGHLAEVAVQVCWRENGQNLRYALLTYFVVDTGLENLR